MAGQSAGMMCLGVLLAAGASRRFGTEDKLMAPLRGAPLVTHAAAALMASGCDRLAAVISSAAVAQALPAGVEPVLIAPGQVMAASFHRAIRLAEDCRAATLLICLGDMPDIPPAVLQALRRGGVTNGCLLKDTPMPPMLLQACDYAAAREAAKGDRGARRFLARLPAAGLIRLTPPQGRDIDLQADLAAAERGDL